MSGLFQDTDGGIAMQSARLSPTSWRKRLCGYPPFVSYETIDGFVEATYWNVVVDIAPYTGDTMRPVKMQSWLGRWIEAKHEMGRPAE